MNCRERRKAVKNSVFLQMLCRFRPPLVCSGLGALLFSAGSLALISGQQPFSFPGVVQYAFFILAALFLTLTVWSLVVLWRKKSPKQMVSEAAHQNHLLSRLWDDRTFRTISLGYGSLALSSLLALSKIIASWWSSSRWQMVLAVYYLALCLSKALVLHNTRATVRQTESHDRARKEWQSYRLCGLLLILLSVSLQGVALLIVREGLGFSYRGNLIYLVALSDFYFLVSSLIYLVRNRKKHLPAILSVKYLSFASSLISMLSLQTAMFAAFGANMAVEDQRLMNTMTGTAVCAILVLLGMAMVVKASRKLRQRQG